MDNIKFHNCEVHTAILHRLNNDSGELELSGLPFTLTKLAHDYVANHITRSLTDSNTARFDNLAASEILGHTRSLSTADFVSSSQELARKLFETMQRNKNIKSGTLLVAHFSEFGKAQNFGAVLKLDETSGVRQVRKLIDGIVKIDFEFENNLMPALDAKLDKAAFIRPNPTEESDYHLRLIDRGSYDDSVARFFLSFLGCTKLVHNRALTNKLDKLTEQWIQESNEQLPPGVTQQDFRSVKNTLLRTSDTLTVDHLAETALGVNNTNAIESLKGFLESHGFKEREVKIDYGNKPASKSTYRALVGQEIIEIKGDPVNMHAIFNVSPPEKEGGKYIITFEADEWVQVPR